MSTAIDDKYANTLEKGCIGVPCNPTDSDYRAGRAKVWLCFSKRNLKLAQLLIETGYYEDVIGFELQQSIEKSLKAILVFYHKPVIDTHDLNLLREAVSEYYLIEDYLIVDLLDTATGYYLNARYPNPDYSAPESKTLLEIQELAHLLFEGAVGVLGIKVGDLCTIQRPASSDVVSL